MRVVDERVRRRQVLAVTAAVAATLVAAALLWWRTHDTIRDGNDVVMSEVGRTTCVPVHETEKIVYGEALANVTDDPVTIVDAHVTATGGAAVESTWLAEPEHAVGVLNQWPPPDMVDAFDSGEVRRAPAPLRPARASSDDGQSLVLFVRMPAGSTITDVSVTYRKAGSTTLYRSNSTTSTLKAVGAPSC